MNFDFFISHSSNDKHVADQVCDALESAGIRCWIAPRDIGSGDEYAAAIIRAIDRCRAMVLIFSASANASRQVPRELERGVSRGVPILPVRIEDVVPTDSLAYYVGSVHWFDATRPPLEDHLQDLVDSANRLLRDEARPANARPDQSPDRSLGPSPTPAATPSARARSIWPAVGKFAAMASIVCAGALVVTFAASRWFESDTSPPVATVAERTVEAPAKMAAQTPQPAQASHSAAQTAEAPKTEIATDSKADIKADAKIHAVDAPAVNKPVAPEAAPPVDTAKSDAPLDAPKTEKIVAVPKDVPSPESSPQPAGAPPGPASSPYFTAEDAKRVEQVAATKKIPLSTYQIANIAPDVPAKFRRYVGIWVTKIGFNGGLGREGMLIISDVDVQGMVSGTYMLGPPTATSYVQRPAYGYPISAKIKNDSLTITTGAATGTVGFASSNALSVKWVFNSGKTAIANFYPVWMLAEHEGAPSAAQARKPN